MTEFASMAMLRVIARGMDELGIAQPEESVAATPRRRATVNLDAKLTLLNHAIATGGLQCLVLLGRGVHHFAEEPAHRAMTSAGSPVGLLQRWQRLEKYLHSLHRVDITQTGELHAQLVHRANRPDSSPSLAEDLVVAGVLAGLLESMGTQNVTIHCGSLPIYPVLNDYDLAALNKSSTSSSWTFRWTSVTPRVQPESCAEPTALFHAHQWPDIARRVGNALVAELILPPTVHEMAKRLAVSSRSLQRKLADHGFSYRQLLGEARSRMAAWRLLETSASLSEIGFLSGYSDQPHFTREFRTLVGVTPAQYRRDFDTDEREPGTLPVKNRSWSVDRDTPR